MNKNTLRLALATTAVVAGGLVGCQTAEPVREYSVTTYRSPEPVGEYTVRSRRVYTNAPYSSTYTVHRVERTAPVGEYIVRGGTVEATPIEPEPVAEYHPVTRTRRVYVSPAPVGESVTVRSTTTGRTSNPDIGQWASPVPYGPNSPTGPSNW